MFLKVAKHIGAAVLLVGLLASAEVLHADTLILREGNNTFECTTLSGSLEGLRYSIADDSSGLTNVVPWSKVKSVQFSHPSTQLELFLEQGDALWRAKQRMLRGDIRLAEPTFMRLFQVYEGVEGLDACLAAEGLLRCSLSRGDLVLAFRPWLETLQHYERGEVSPYPLPPVIDEATSLCKHLPPVQLVRDDFLEAAKQNKLQIAGHAEGGQFLAHILSATQGDKASMQFLEDSLEEMPDWKQVWSHYFLAMGYLDVQDSPKHRTAGLLHLAKIASLPTNIQPWLSGAALFRLAQEFSQDGAQAIADRMLNELRAHYPSHPLLSTAQTITRNTDK